MCELGNERIGGFCHLERNETDISRPSDDLSWRVTLLQREKPNQRKINLRERGKREHGRPTSPEKCRCKAMGNNWSLFILIYLFECKQYPRLQFLKETCKTGKKILYFSIAQCSVVLQKNIRTAGTRKVQISIRNNMMFLCMHSL